MVCLQKPSEPIELSNCYKHTNLNKKIPTKEKEIKHPCSLRENKKMSLKRALYLLSYESKKKKKMSKVV